MEIGHKELTINSIKELIENKDEIILSEKATKAIVKCRAYLDKKINEKGTKYYPRGLQRGMGCLGCYFQVVDLDPRRRTHYDLYLCRTGGFVRLA